jgi:hypothetical protein
MIEEKDIGKVFLVIGIFFILLAGATLGAYYADTNWKYDIKKVSDNNFTYLKFDNSGIVYQITQYNLSSNKNGLIILNSSK